ncbi:MAG TPA: ABC transporter ATP-binding protein [Candidatus Paceibacterota bacterium]|nr:ABC transporter ATP-binding protein [Candidatus Paceibacterota bacterium]
MALIELESLRKVYAIEGVESVALQDISLNIDKGEFVAVMGPSGSGKSTLLHILGFLDLYTSGKYLFDGREMSKYTEEEMAHIRNHKMGFVFQSFNLLARTSVLDNVKLPLLYSSIPENQWQKRALEAIEAVGLTHRLNHQPSQLSGGEKQRAAIARALVCDPQVIFADEPTGNLDSKSGQLVMETIQQLNEKMGHTIVLITHETYTAETAQRVIRLHDGLVQSDEKVVHRRQAKEHFEK